MDISTWFNAYFDITTIILLILIVYSLNRIRHLKTLPPGPFGLPILGYLPFLALELPFKRIAKLSRSYGNVISVQLGSFPVIFLNDYQSMKEGFADSNACSLRPSKEILDVLVPKQYQNLAVANGARATQHRRFILTVLKELGVGKQSLEPKILDEINHLVDEIKSLNGIPTNLWTLLTASSANVIWLLEYGRRFEYTDEVFQKILMLSDEFSRQTAIVNIRIFLPWIKYVPILNLFIGDNSVRHLLETVHQIFYEKLRSRQLIDVKGDNNCYVDACLTERANQIEKNGNEGFFEIDDLVGNTALLFGAGAETTASTILWGILYLIKYPRTYKKIEKEIQDVIGTDREPSVSDKPNMPFIQAFLMETTRCTPVLPFSLVHRNAENTTIAGQPIPKNSLIIGNIWAVHHDPKLWKDPDVFRPERFIDDNEQLKKSEYLIPFSIGKRNCVGESLAQMELFLIFTSLCQRFRFEMENGISPCFDGDLGLIYKPKPHMIRAIAK